jgi:hypothetical protein
LGNGLGAVASGMIALTSIVFTAVSAPLGEHDDTKLLNIGSNRWSFRPELGISKAWGPWTVEIAPSVTFFTDNADFFNGKTFAQAPLYLFEGTSFAISRTAHGFRWMVPAPAK